MGVSRSVKEPNRLLVCATCERSDGKNARDDCAHLRVGLKRVGLGDAIEVKATPCLGGCVAPVNIALQGQGRGSYVFDGLDIKSFELEILKLCELYLALDQGWIEDARPLGPLRYRLRARIPVLDEATYL